MALFRVSDLLYFVNFKRKINSVADIVSICESFYSADAIVEAKKIFFDCVAEKIGDKNDGVLRFIDRRGKGGETPQKMNLKDLIAAMNKCDNDGIDLPMFVSSDPTKIPASNDGNVSLNQLMLMMIEMKKQIASLEKRSFCGHCASASSSLAAASSGSSNDTLESGALSASFSAASSSDVTSGSSQQTPFSPSLPPPLPPLSAGSALLTANGAHGSTVSGTDAENWNKVAERGAKSRVQQPIKSAENRIKTNQQRNKNIVIGKKPSSGAMSWSGADLTVESYIGRVPFTVDADTIKADLTSNGYEIISIEENETRHQRFKSFKMVVKQSEFEKLLKFPWPEGVLYRRFWRPRPSLTGREEPTPTV